MFFTNLFNFENYHLKDLWNTIAFYVPWDCSYVELDWNNLYADMGLELIGISHLYVCSL